MNNHFQSLLSRANKLTANIKKAPGTRYPEELKAIVCQLRNEYKLSVSDICKRIPISSYSAREWPKQNKNKFKKVSVLEPIAEDAKSCTSRVTTSNNFISCAIIINQIVLISLLALSLFESLFFSSS